MFIPAITPENVRNRMTLVWANANRAWQMRMPATARLFMREYDYLSNWQRDDCYATL